MFTEPVAHKLRIGFVRVFLLRRVPNDKRTGLFILGRNERPRKRVVEAEVSRPLPRNSDSAGDTLVVCLDDCLDAADVFGPGRNNSGFAAWFGFALCESVRQRQNEGTLNDSEGRDFHAYPPAGNFQYAIITA